MSEDKNEPVEIDVEIPVTAFVPCPLTGDFSLVSVKKKCSECDYFQGLFKASYPSA